MNQDRREAGRVVSLDQFRGYTVLGMFWVNFIGSVAATPAIFKHHHTFCSYADTIMPHFFFAVGFSYRLALLKRLATVGPRAAYLHFFKRALGLILVGFALYHLDGGFKSWQQALDWVDSIKNADWWEKLRIIFMPFRRDLFQTLVHIAVTTIWVMPVMAKGQGVRIAYALFSGGLFVALSYLFYYDTVNNNPRGIDGGPLGFLTWTIPLVAGSIAHDWIMAAHVSGTVPSESAGTGPQPPAAAGPSLAGVVVRLLTWGFLLMLLAYGLACLNLVVPAVTEFEKQTAERWPKGNEIKLAREHAIEMPAEWLVEPPFFPPSRPVSIWTMSQRSGSITYLTFGAGFSLFLYALFVVACDILGLRVGMFTTLGANALAAYIIHWLVGDAIKPWVPRDAPFWYAVLAFLVFFAICYLFLKYLEKHRLYLRL